MEITQPRVARNELPWDNTSNAPYPERVTSASRYSFAGTDESRPASIVSAVTACNNFNFKLNFNIMNKVTMLEFRKDAQSVLRRVARGERFVLSLRGRPVARLEPIAPAAPSDPDSDPFLGIARRAAPSPKGKTRHQDIDRILYGRR
jgi:prevent-host-death family protein